jgi:hypothetical protein
LFKKNKKFKKCKFCDIMILSLYFSLLKKQIKPNIKARSKYLLRLVTGFSLNVGFLTCDLLRNVYLNRFKPKKNFLLVKLVYFQNEL